MKKEGDFLLTGKCTTVWLPLSAESIVILGLNFGICKDRYSEKDVVFGKL